jgi:hypothetical protein
MKRIITAAAALLFSAATFAQDSQTPPAQDGPRMNQHVQMTPDQRAKRETDRINATTALGDEVYQKVLKVNTDFEKQRAAIMGGAKKNEMTDDQRSQLKKINEDKNKQIQAAMGHDLYEKWKAAERTQRQERGNQGGAPAENQK